MSVRTVRPGVASGRIAAPPSKSYTHRALVAGHLTGRRYRVERPLLADDTRATARGLRELGSRVRAGRGRWTIEPGGSTRPRRGTIDCGESGTTLRFLLALAARQDRPIRFRGQGRLGRRPVSELLDAIGTLGAESRRASAGGGFPITVRGPMRGGRIRLDASRSSQFASALLLTLPTLPGDSELRLVGRVVSEPYIAATEAVLRRHRVVAERHGRAFAIPGDQTFRGTGMVVPGDASSAAYLWAAAAVTGGSVDVRGIPRSWPQADLAILGLLRAAGVRVVDREDGARVEGPLRAPFSVDLTAAPDLYPLVAVLAATVPGRSRLRGAAHAVLKESDRRAGAARLARAFGAAVEPRGGGLDIRGSARVHGARLRDLTDHRLVMSAAVGALAADRPSTIGDARAVAKSFPQFWTALDSLFEGERE